MWKVKIDLLSYLKKVKYENGQKDPGNQNLSLLALRTVYNEAIIFAQKLHDSIGLFLEEFICFWENICSNPYREYVISEEFTLERFYPKSEKSPRKGEIKVECPK
jgi:hypothetical protein